MWYFIYKILHIFATLSFTHLLYDLQVNKDATQIFTDDIIFFSSLTIKFCQEVRAKIRKK